MRGYTLAHERLRVAANTGLLVQDRLVRLNRALDEMSDARSKLAFALNEQGITKLKLKSGEMIVAKKFLAASCDEDWMEYIPHVGEQTKFVRICDIAEIVE